MDEAIERAWVSSRVARHGRARATGDDQQSFVIRLQRVTAFELPRPMVVDFPQAVLIASAPGLHLHWFLMGTRELVGSRWPYELRES